MLSGLFGPDLPTLHDSLGKILHKEIKYNTNKDSKGGLSEMVRAFMSSPDYSAFTVDKATHTKDGTVGVLSSIYNYEQRQRLPAVYQQILSVQQGLQQTYQAALTCATTARQEIEQKLSRSLGAFQGLNTFFKMYAAELKELEEKSAELRKVSQGLIALKVQLLEYAAKKSYKLATGENKKDVEKSSFSTVQQFIAQWTRKLAEIDSLKGSNLVTPRKSVVTRQDFKVFPDISEQEIQTALLFIDANQREIQASLAQLESGNLAWQRFAGLLVEMEASFTQLDPKRKISRLPAFKLQEIKTEVTAYVAKLAHQCQQAAEKITEDLADLQERLKENKDKIESLPALLNVLKDTLEPLVEFFPETKAVDYLKILKKYLPDSKNTDEKSLVSLQGQGDFSLMEFLKYLQKWTPAIFNFLYEMNQLTLRDLNEPWKEQDFIFTPSDRVKKEAEFKTVKAQKQKPFTYRRFQQKRDFDFTKFLELEAKSPFKNPLQASCFRVHFAYLDCIEAYNIYETVKNQSAKQKGAFVNLIAKTQLLVYAMNNFKQVDNIIREEWLKEEKAKSSSQMSAILSKTQSLPKGATLKSHSVMDLLHNGVSIYISKEYPGFMRFQGFLKLEWIKPLEQWLASVASNQKKIFDEAMLQVQQEQQDAITEQKAAAPIEQRVSAEMIRSPHFEIKATPPVTAPTSMGPSSQTQSTASTSESLTTQPAAPLSTETAALPVSSASTTILSAAKSTESSRLGQSEAELFQASISKSLRMYKKYVQDNEPSAGSSVVDGSSSSQATTDTSIGFET